MKRILSLATLCAALLPVAAAHADSISFTLSNPNQSVTTAGGMLYYSGTITANAANTGLVYLNGDDFSVSGGGVMDDSPYFQAPAFLSAGNSYTGVLFTVTLNAGGAASNSGYFSILGGSDGNAQNALATVNFQSNIAPAAVATTPEPSSFLLLATGALGSFTLLRRRLGAAV